MKAEHDRLDFVNQQFKAQMHAELYVKAISNVNSTSYTFVSSLTLRLLPPDSAVNAILHISRPSFEYVLLAPVTYHLAALSRCRSVRQLMPRYTQISLMF